MTYDLGGRWTSGRLHYALDIARCGDGWCGVRLNADASCGAVVLRLQQMATAGAGSSVTLSGHLDLQPDFEPYAVSIVLDATGNAAPETLSLLGNPSVAPSLFTRTLAFSDLLVRSGPAICKAEPKTS